MPELLKVILFWLLAGTASLSANLEMLQPGFLFWTNGPPNLNPDTGGGGSYVSAKTDQRYLAVLNGHYFIEIDVWQGRINRFRMPGPGETFETTGNNGLDKIPVPAEGDYGRISWDFGDGSYVFRANQKLEYEPELFPVRIIESGPWFQHFTVHDLVLEGEGLDESKGDFWMEIKAWPGRILLSLKTLDGKLARKLVRKAEKAPSISGLPGFEGSLPSLKQTEDGRTVHGVVRLAWRNPHALPMGGTVHSNDPRTAVTRDTHEGIPSIELAPMRHDPGERTPLGSPARKGAGAAYQLRIVNPAGEARRLDMRIELPPDRSMTGHSLMLVDAMGNQVGIPVQISKNWHKKEIDTLLPHMGTWSHGRLSVVLPPAFYEQFALVLVQGNYGDFHAASIAQLSLVGWGGNGFWVQAALGSWGETVCLQPGRVLRRTFMTDWRSFLSQAMGGGNYNWTPNAGGADLFVYFNEEGDYVPFIGNKHRIRSYGPCLAWMDFHEMSKDRKVAVSGSWFLPMSNDVARTYLKVRCEFLDSVPFSRFSFFQMGADRYNPGSYGEGALGADKGLILKQSFGPGLGRGGYLKEPLILKGAAPWITLYGEEVDKDARLGQAQRILVVRDWKAVIGGEPELYPRAVFYNSNLHGKDSLQAELVPPVGTTQFDSGDFVEMTLELVLVPLSRDSYHGPSHEIRRLLGEFPDQWRMGSAIAVGNMPKLEVGSQKVLEGPLPQMDVGDLGQSMQLTGSSALVPLAIKGISEKGDVQLQEENGKLQAKSTRQWIRDPDGTWRVVLMLDPEQIPEAFSISLE